MISRLVHNSWLHPLDPGVFAVGHLAPVPLGPETAALLAVRGPVLSHHSAAELWGMRPAGSSDELVHVLVSGEAGRRRRGVRVHRTRFLEARDVRIRDRLTVTSPARTLLDNVPLLSGRELELSYDQAIVSRHVRSAEIAELVSRANGHRGQPRLARLLETSGGPGVSR